MASNEQGTPGNKYSLNPLPKYDGDTTQLLIAVWRYRVNRHFTMAQELNRVTFTEEQKVTLVSEQFRGRAATWWTAKIIAASIPRNLDDLEKSMKAYFELEGQHLKIVRRNYRNAHQRTTVSQYNDYFNELVVQLPNMPEDQTISDYIQGLKEDIALRVEEAEPETLPDAMSLALDKERYVSKKKGHQYDSGYIPHGNNRRGRDRAKGSDHPRDKQEPRSKMHITCFLCNNKGHYASECPASPRTGQDSGRRDKEALKQERFEKEKKAYLKKTGLAASDDEDSDHLNE